MGATMQEDVDLEGFRAAVVAFLDRAQADGVACAAFGAILPPALHDRARTWQRHMADAGFAGLHWPLEYGGRGRSAAHTAVWTEECARAQVAPYLNLQGIVLAGGAILRSGIDEQRRRFLPPTLTGEVLWCQLFSEPGAGSDLTSLSTSARRDGDRYVDRDSDVPRRRGKRPCRCPAAPPQRPSHPGEPAHQMPSAPGASQGDSGLWGFTQVRPYRK